MRSICAKQGVACQATPCRVLQGVTPCRTLFPYSTGDPAGPCAVHPGSQHAAVRCSSSAISSLCRLSARAQLDPASLISSAGKALWGKGLPPGVLVQVSQWRTTGAPQVLRPEHRARAPYGSELRMGISRQCTWFGYTSFLLPLYHDSALSMWRGSLGRQACAALLLVSLGISLHLPPPHPCFAILRSPGGERVVGGGLVLRYSL